MSDYNQILASCVRVIDAHIDSPVFPQESPEECEDLVRMHYDKLGQGNSEIPDYDAFKEEVFSHFDLDDPPPVIKEHQVGGWLDTAMRDTTMQRWNHYRTMLIADGKKSMLPYLDADTFTLLDCCLNPKEEGQWDRRGLAYGYVQSGKTANYTGLINKAFDMGYRIVILFTGMTEDLRQQTQDRVNEGIVGRDEKNLPYGVGRQKGFPFGIKKGTTHVADFSNAILPAHIANLSLNDNIVFVIKKNVHILKNLIKWLKKKSDEQRSNVYKITGTPFLIIDDEADNASINSLTKKEKDSGEYDPKAINRSIRTILSLIEQKSFVAYTATPYSVVLQRMEDDARNWTIDGAEYHIDENSDLFPEHFIVPIRHGSEYLGIERVFGSGSQPGLSIVVQIDHDTGFQDDILPNGGFFTTGRGTSYHFTRLPDSLQHAILHYVTTIIVRQFRDHDDHNSMLVHTSHEVHKIDYLADYISLFLQHIQNAVLHEPDMVASCNVHLETIRQNAADPRFREYFGEHHTYKIPDAITAAQVHEVIKNINLVSLHSRKNDATLRHKNHTLRYDRDHKRNHIIVGGNRLSRGLTILGLSTSYFVRRSTRKDSLYQMGRWFGYRIGFEDCVQIYTDSDLYYWFSDIMNLELRLRRDFENMNSHDEMTPANWEIKVARSTAADSLNRRMEITDPNKLRYTAQRRMDLGGQSLRTKYFQKDVALQKTNLETVLRLIDKLRQEGFAVPGAYPPENRNLNFAGVPYTHITTFLNAFQFHPEQSRDFDDLRVFLENHGNDLHSFSVVMKRLKKDNSYRTIQNVAISPIQRSDVALPGDDFYEIDALIDGDKDNTFDIINEYNQEEYEDENTKKATYRYNLRNETRQALLIIYTVEGAIGGDGGTGLFPSLYFFIPTVGTRENVLVRE